jgi:hypothetical protein
VKSIDKDAEGVRTGDAAVGDAGEQSEDIIKSVAAFFG